MEKNIKNDKIKNIQTIFDMLENANVFSVIEIIALMDPELFLNVSDMKKIVKIIKVKLNELYEKESKSYDDKKIKETIMQIDNIRENFKRIVGENVLFTLKVHGIIVDKLLDLPNDDYLL